MWSRKTKKHIAYVEVSAIYSILHFKRQNYENFFESPVAAGEVWQAQKCHHYGCGGEREPFLWSL